MLGLLFRTLRENETSAILCVLEALNGLKDQSLRDVVQTTLVAQLLQPLLVRGLLQSVTIRAERYGFLRFTFKQPTNSFSLLTAPSFLLY